LEAVRAIAPDAVETLVIGKNEKDVGFRGVSGAGGTENTQQTQQEEREDSSHGWFLVTK
jgi:hypothetical protein